LPEDGSALTYRSLADQVEALAAVLRQGGLGPGERVAIVLPNGVDYLVSFLAVTRARLVAAPLNPAYKPEGFHFYLTHAAAPSAPPTPNPGPSPGPPGPPQPGTRPAPSACRCGPPAATPGAGYISEASGWRAPPVGGGRPTRPPARRRCRTTRPCSCTPAAPP